MRCTICGGGTPGGNRHFIVDEYNSVIGVLCDECAAKPPPHDLHERATWPDAWTALYYGRHVGDLTRLQRVVLTAPATVAKIGTLLFTLGTGVVLVVWLFLALAWEVLKDKLCSPLPEDVGKVRRLMSRG